MAAPKWRFAKCFGSNMQGAPMTSMRPSQINKKKSSQSAQCYRGLARLSFPLQSFLQLFWFESWHFLVSFNTRAQPVTGTDRGANNRFWCQRLGSCFFNPELSLAMIELGPCLSSPQFPPWGEWCWALIQLIHLKQVQDGKDGQIKMWLKRRPHDVNSPGTKRLIPSRETVYFPLLLKIASSSRRHGLMGINAGKFPKWTGHNGHLSATTYKRQKRIPRQSRLQTSTLRWMLNRDVENVSQISLLSTCPQGNLPFVAKVCDVPNIGLSPRPDKLQAIKWNYTGFILIPACPICCISYPP